MKFKINDKVIINKKGVKYMLLKIERYKVNISNLRKCINYIKYSKEYGYKYHDNIEAVLFLINDILIDIYKRLEIKKE